MNNSIAQSPIVKFTRRTNAARSTMLLLVVLSVVNVAMLTFGGRELFFVFFVVYISFYDFRRGK